MIGPLFYCEKSLDVLKYEVQLCEEINREGSKWPELIGKKAWTEQSV